MNHDLYRALQEYSTPRAAILEQLLNQCKYVKVSSAPYDTYFFKHDEDTYYYVRAYKYKNQISVLQPLSATGMQMRFWDLPNNPMHELALAAKELET